MHIASLSNRQLASYASHVGAAGVFSRYVIAQRPDAESLAVVHENQVLGMAIAGSTVELFEAYPHWIFASSPQAACLLAEATHSEAPAINFPLSYLDLFQRIYREQAISIDRLYVLPQSRCQATPPDDRVLRLDAEKLKELHISNELRSLIGSLNAWQQATVLYGVVEDGKLIATGEILVQDQHSGAIQQIYTLPAYRERGLAQRLTSTLAQTLIAQRKLPIYVAADDNRPSCRVAEKLGFILESRWGFVG